MKPALAFLAWLALTGAVSRPVTFTLPTNAVTRQVEAIVRRPDGIEFAVALYRDSARTQPPVIGAPGSPMRLWFLQSEAWRDGATICWVRCCNTAGCGDWSNRSVGVVGVPDTLFTLVRGPGAKPLPSYPWKRSINRRVGWGLAPGDSAKATIYPQESIQRAHSQRIVQLYPSLGWGLRGGYILAPDFNPPRIDP